MLENTSEHEIFINKRTDKVYLSKAIEQVNLKPSDNDGFEEIKRDFRIISKVFDCIEAHEFIKQGNQANLRITEGHRHEIVAKFYEDTRGVLSLQIQKFSIESGNPHKLYFTFINDEIKKLYNFIKNIALIPIENRNRKKFDDNFLNEVVLSKEQSLKLISEDPELLEEILKQNISKLDIIALAYRKDQLKIFNGLLSDSIYFENFKCSNNIPKDESVWQFFFEKNTWIFGYGLNYIFNSPLSGKKLEQVVSGYNVFSGGKRIDALMQTKGIISSLCFGELKTHKTHLINKEYRPESYSISNELAGGIAQVQRTIQKSLKDLNTKLDIKDNNRNPTGESIFLYQPKAFLIIGSLQEFATEHGVNEDKYSSFELFRRNLNNPEIITFDELYERARYIVESSDLN